MSNLISFDDFLKVDIRVGTIVEAKVFENANKPAYQLLIDLGAEIGVKKSSAQISKLYSIDDLLNKQVLCVVNFPPKQIANFMSEVLVLGIYSKHGVVLIQPEQKVQNGERLG
ncbi:MAG: tRNA-binding protein [Peptostreptococcaceae bacterium]|nr:tRNA-binding protein [Peptostreptococcaceae bacterium]